MKIKIGARNYDIEFNNFSEIFEKNPDAWSYISYPESKIVLKNTSSEDFMKENLLHEILHSLIENSGIQEEIGEYEKIIKILTPRLLDFLKSNKEFINYITS